MKKTAYKKKFIKKSKPTKSDPPPNAVLFASKTLKWVIK